MTSPEAHCDKLTRLASPQLADDLPAQAPALATPRLGNRPSTTWNRPADLSPGTAQTAAHIRAFAVDDQSLALLVAIHAVLSMVWLSTYVLLLSQLKTQFAKPRVRQWLDRVTGTALVGFGGTIASQPRP